MGKASSTKKVARAARTGGGRTRRGSASWAWPSLICLIVVLGTVLVVFSKQDQSSADSTAPVVRKDHWHAAVGFDICGDFAAPITDQNDPLGIHTHGDGVIHIHPFSSTAAGKNATLGKFFDAVQAEVSQSQIKLPGQETKKNGMKCGDKPAEVRVRTWDSDAPDAPARDYTGNPSDLRPQDGQLITIAFLPADAEIPRPPTAGNLRNLTDVPGATTIPTPPVSTPPVSTPPAEPPASTPPAEPPASAPQPAP